MAVISTRRVVTVLLILATTSACGIGARTPAPRTPSAARTSSPPTDLSGVLIQPAGFIAVPNDTISGPLRTPDDVRRFFTDRPRDPAEILSHGFVAGYVQQWQVPQNPSSGGSTVVVATTLLEIVVQFDTAAHALTVEQYFRQAPSPLGPITSFAVPSSLASGYGQYQAQGSGTAATYLYAVVWVSGNRMFEVGMEYSAPGKSPSQAISIALAQNRADGG